VNTLIRLVVKDDEGQFYRYEPINAPDGLSDEAYVVYARGLLYQENWVQVMHAVAVQRPGGFWDPIFDGIDSYLGGSPPLEDRKFSDG
jgi:hypothetical protein